MISDRGHPFARPVPVGHVARGVACWHGSVGDGVWDELPKP